MAAKLDKYVRAAIKCGPVPKLRDFEKISPSKWTRGERVIAFIHRYCRTPDGALVGQPLRLAPFQQAFILAVYDNPAGTRRAYLSIARKNGKSGIVAGLLLAHICGPEAVQNSQITSGAMSRDQAALVFNLAAKMVQLSPDLGKLCRIVPSGKRILGLARNVEFRALAADGTTAHGLSPVVAVLDEVGQIVGPQSDFVDAITTSQGAHATPLLLVISTQAPSDGSLLSIWLDDAEQSNDPRIVSHVYAADPDAEIDDEDAWKASNPALGLFRNLEDLREQANQAKRMPSAANTFRNLCLNQRINSNSSLISREDWVACTGDSTWELGEKVYLALDLSAKVDLCALVGVSVENGSRLQAWFWKPGETIDDHEKRDRVPYRQWVKDGWIEAGDGRSIHPASVAMKIAELTTQYDVVGLAYDRWGMDNLLREFDGVGLQAHSEDDGDGLRLIPWGQGFASMGPAIEAFEVAVMHRELVHPNNPVLTWNIANAVATSDPAGNRKLNKQKARFRIDGAVAAAMALGVKSRERTPEMTEPEVFFL